MSAAPTHRYFRRWTVNDRTGERRLDLIATGQPPLEVAPYKARDGWRVVGVVEELDHLPAYVGDRLAAIFVERLRRKHPGRTVTLELREPQPEPRVIAWWPTPGIPKRQA